MAAGLLSIDVARARVLATVAPLPSESVPVGEALGRILAGEVAAAHDVPRFANSAMDGFAVRAGAAGRRLRVVGETRAGRPTDRTVGEDEAIRISTGAVVPEGANAVARIEDTTERDTTVTVRTALAAGENVRAPGEDMRSGAAVLAAGLPLGPAELGVAVNAGRGELRCARRPLVTVLATGDELRAPGAPLGPGQIHNSNAIALAALAQAAGARVLGSGVVADDRAHTEAALAAALESSDVIVVSGGVSVGPHDHVKPALAALGVRERFWGVALKPGKPTWFGTRGPRLVFGLPGNPVSSFVTFVLFVRPALAALQGAAAAPVRRPAILTVAVARMGQREQALRVRLDPGEPGDPPSATPTGDQDSHVMSSLLNADGLAFVAPGEGVLAAGEPVGVEPI